MKKLFLFLMVSVLLVSAFFFNTGTARAGSAPILINVHYVTGKGIVFVFALNGSSARAPNLKGAVLYLDGNSYPLACKVNKDAGTIVCTVRGGLSQDFGGHQGSVSLLGLLYSVIIPGPPDPIQKLPDDDECQYPSLGIVICDY